MAQVTNDKGLSKGSPVKGEQEEENCKGFLEIEYESLKNYEGIQNKAWRWDGQKILEMKCNSRFGVHRWEKKVKIGFKHTCICYHSHAVPASCQKMRNSLRNDVPTTNIMFLEKAF